MNVRALVAGAFAAGAVLALAPSARADGFYITFSGGTVPLGGRLVGGTLDANSVTTTDVTGQATGAARPILKIELDDWDNVEGMINSIATNTELSALVEFTAPDANGQEQVYMTASFAHLLFTKLEVDYDATATPKAKQALELSYASVTYATPAPPATATTPTPGTRVVRTSLVRPMPSKVPTITRQVNMLARTKIAIASSPLRVDDAYLEAPGLTGESADHPGKTRLLTLSAHIDAPRDTSTGQVSGKRQYKPLVLTKATGTSTPQLQQARASNKVFTSMTVSCVQKTTGQPDKTAHTLTLTNAVLTKDDLSVGGGSSSETLNVAFQKLAVASGATSISVVP